MSSSDPGVDSAIDFVRGNFTADLRFDEHVQPVKYVVAPAGGRLVMPAMVAMLRALDTVLVIPEDRAEPDTMELMVSLQEFSEREGEHAHLADRWRIYHGEPEDVRWALATIDAARFNGLFIDGEAFALDNPLAAAEPALCKEMNASHVDRLRELCQTRGRACLRRSTGTADPGISVERPVMVGIDPLGIDVRAAFDIVRVRFPRRAGTIAEARQMLGV